MPNVEAALRYLEIGIPVFPLARGTKKPLKGSHGWQDGTTNEEVIRDWWDKYPDSNIAIPTGSISGLILIDEDNDEAKGKFGSESIKYLTEDLGPLPPTWEATTAHGGYHRVFKYPAGAKIYDSEGLLDGSKGIAPAVDVRATGGYFVAAPSRLRDGGRYVWEASSIPTETPLAELPEAWVKHLEAYSGASGAASTEAGRTSTWTRFKLPDEIKIHGRNSTLFRYGCSLRARGADDGEIADKLLAANSARCKPPLPEREVRTIAGSVGRYPRGARRSEAVDGGKKLKPDDFSDAGARDIFCREYGGSLAWTPGGGWHAWDGQRWRPGAAAEAKEAVVKFAGDMLAEARQQHIDAAKVLAEAQANEAEPDKIEKLTKEATSAKKYLSFAQNRRNYSPLMSVLKLSESRLRVDDKKFDADSNLLNLENGVLDLTTLELLPHEPEYRLSKISGTIYDPDADTTEVEEFFDSIFPDDAEKKSFLKRIAGYSLTGEPKEDKAFFFYGPTSRNGKSSLAGAIAFMFGDYSASLSAESLGCNRYADGGRARPDLIPLSGARFVVVEEPDRELNIDCGLFKKLTGGGEIEARQLRCEQTKFRMSGPIFMLCNNLPIISDSSIFASRRILVLPFERHFEEHEINPDIRNILRNDKNRAAWLKIALEGLADYRRNGLTPPLCVQAATEAYSKSGDVILKFLDSCTEHGAGVKGADLFNRFGRWAEENHFPVLRKGQFLDELRNRNLLAKTATISGKTEYNVIVGRRLIG